MPGMRDVAKLAGVSLSTVSVVLNDKSDKFVSPEHRLRVISAAKQLDYRIPPKKEVQLQKTIAVILPVITSSFFPNVLAGIGAVAREHGYTLLYCDSNREFDKELAYLEMLKKHALKGIILDSICLPREERDYLRMLREDFLQKRGLPIVFLERDPEDESFYSVSVDNYTNAYLATQYLAKAGHKRIAHIQGSPMFPSASQRLNGYLQALRDNDLQVDPRILCEGDFFPLSGYAAMKRLLEICPDFTAVFSANDQMAIGAIKAIKESGRRVPDDISVVGFDNISHASVIDPALTTINVPTYQMGSQAAQIIVDTQEGRPSAKRHKLAANLIVRKSSDLLASNDWDIMDI